jgi:hypothetical protein
LREEQNLLKDAMRMRSTPSATSYHHDGVKTYDGTYSRRSFFVEMTQSMNVVIHHYHFLIVTVQVMIEYREINLVSYILIY